MYSFLHVFFEALNRNYGYPCFIDVGTGACTDKVT